MSWSRRVQHRGVARCDVVVLHRAMSLCRTVRCYRVARCEVRVLHRAEFTCRTVRSFMSLSAWLLGRFCLWGDFVADDAEIASESDCRRLPRLEFNSSFTVASHSCGRQSESAAKSSASATKIHPHFTRRAYKKRRGI